MANPDWTRDELILALDLYFREPKAQGNGSHSGCVELSKILNSLPIHDPVSRDSTFRNPNGVGMKLINFRKYDPTFKGKGLPAGSRLEEEVWNSFASDLPKLTEVSNTIKNKIYMPFTNQDFLELFTIGETIRTEAQKAKSTIDEITKYDIYLIRGSTKKYFKIEINNIICIANHFDEVNNAKSRKLENRVLATLKKHGSIDTSSETYIYAFAKELIRRMQFRSKDEQVNLLEYQLTNIKYYSTERLRALSKLFPKQPTRIPARPGQTNSDIIRRNPYIVQIALLRAAGICEHCKAPAPFTRASDGSPYLEVHHNIPISKNGLDIEENVSAVCPNCHRKAHFG